MDSSIDRKARASGEREDEQPQPPQKEPLHEYASEALDYLLIFTRSAMADEEQILWVNRLSKYPKWKLSKLADFSSPFINEVWNFLDKLQPEPETYQAPARAQIEHKSQIHKDVLKHILDIYFFKGSQEDKLKIEFESLENLDKKYPNAGFDGVIAKRRIDGVNKRAIRIRKMAEKAKAYQKGSNVGSVL